MVPQGLAVRDEEPDNLLVVIPVPSLQLLRALQVSTAAT
jgi:hypothetical protein